MNRDPVIDTEHEMPITKQQLYQVLDTVESLEGKLKEQTYNDKNPVYSHQHQQLPERPMRENGDFYDIKVPINPHYSPLSSHRPLTLQQSFKKPMVQMNLPQRRPDIKHKPELSRRPPHKSHGPPQRLPYVPSGSNIPPFNQFKQKNHLNKNGVRPPTGGPINRFEHHVSPRPTSPQPRPMQTQPRPTQPQPRPTPSQPKINHLPMNIRKLPSKNYQHQSQQVGVIMGKPVNNLQSYMNLAAKPTVFDRAGESLNIPETDVIGVHVVKSQITLPSPNDALDQSLRTNTQGQIILGKPMENPIPMDQQMIQTAPKVMSITPSYTIYAENHGMPAEIHSANSEIKSSDFIGEKPDPVQLSEPAVNTGFKPDSIVVESGFKPIIREPLMASEDRITDYLHEANRREDTNVESDYEEEESSFGHKTNHILSNSEYKPITQHFEPMFIPSPPDIHFIQENEITKNPSTTDSKKELSATQEESKTEISNIIVNEVTKKVYTVSNANVKLNHVIVNQTSKDSFPKNHAKEDRPQPVYHPNDTSLFSVPNLNKETPDEMMIAADTVDTHYLPPYSNKKTPKPALTFTSYDGKTISAETLTDVDGDTSKLSNKSKLLTKTPQVGPYKGDLPDVLAEEINKKSVHTRPIESTRVTNLKLVNTQLHYKEPQELQAQASDLVTDFLESLFDFGNASKENEYINKGPVNKEDEEKRPNENEEEEYYEDEENEDDAKAGENTEEPKEETNLKTRQKREIKNTRLYRAKGYLNTNWQHILLS